ncbi:MAG: c-type cytochrome [Ignavibacteria bacterium]|nr:c-type cytochrome [Ignavibacteria bacterium]
MLNIHVKQGLTLLICLLSVLFAGCPTVETGPAIEPDYVLPTGFPQFPIPSDNPINAEKIDLGRRLFYDTRLSSDNTIACANCHKQEFAFTDGGMQVSRGVDRELGNRNSPTVVNSGYAPSLFFDGRAPSIEEQAFGAFTNPIEMRADVAVIDKFLMNDSAYVAHFSRAFGTGSVPSSKMAMKAIATFIRTVLSGNSRYDQYIHGNKSALNPSELRGMNLFFDYRTQCATCHSGYNFTDNEFHSTGLFTHYYDKGRHDFTRNPVDVGKFKTPTLRNIALTDPYMHDGHLATLEETLDHYNQGGKQFINKDPRILPLKLTQEEKNDLIAFLQSLTDEELIHNPKFGKK